MWEILVCKGFLPLKIQRNSKKSGFGKEKSVEDMVTLGPTGTGHTIYYKILVGLKCNHTINVSTNGYLNKVSG
jgi:hypothetical protein